MVTTPKWKHPESRYELRAEMDSTNRSALHLGCSEHAHVAADLDTRPWISVGNVMHDLSWYLSSCRVKSASISWRTSGVWQWRLRKFCCQYQHCWLSVIQKIPLCLRLLACMWKTAMLTTKWQGSGHHATLPRCVSLLHGHVYLIYSASVHIWSSIGHWPLYTSLPIVSTIGQSNHFQWNKLCCVFLSFFPVLSL